MGETAVAAGSWERLATLCAVSLLLLVAIAVASLQIAGWPFITLAFLRGQDVSAFAFVIVGLITMRRLVRSPAIAHRLASAMPRHERFPVSAVAAFVCLVSFAGVWLVFADYPLSMDEFWARADGLIFARGVPLARIPDEWAPYARMLQPLILHVLPDARLWSSDYLPVNALLQLALGPFAGPLLAATSVMLVASIARTLMPNDRGAPLVAALLLGSSSQLLLTAMTPYSMSAHLAFNLAWLWLFLRHGFTAQIAAGGVGFLAMGLHQLSFFPLFALPFLAEAFLCGQRRRSIAHAITIILGALLWSNYDGIVTMLMGVTPAAGAARDTGWVLGKLLTKIGGFDLQAVGLMGANLFRFQLWQNPLALPLALLAVPKVISRPSPLRACLGGIVLVCFLMLFVQPFQGHGWGYRYLHGELGSVALLGTYAWFRLADRTSAACQAYFLSMLAFAVLILLPLRAYQAWQWTAPYVAANRALHSADADLVVIDAPQHAYTEDLVRNSPWLDNEPKRIFGVLLDDKALAQLCRRYRIVFFTDDDAERYGIVGFRDKPEVPARHRTCAA